MTTDRDPADGKKSPGGAKNDENRKKPGWTEGLRQLYDSVVDEPLPDSFKDLLSKLDDKS